MSSTACRQGLPSNEVLTYSVELSFLYWHVLSLGVHIFSGSASHEVHLLDGGAIR
jgi:hypothetical protein